MRHFRIGSHFFKVNLDNEPPKDHTVFIVPALKPSTEEEEASSIEEAPERTQDSESAPIEDQTPAAAPETPSVQFQGMEGTFTIPPSDSILETAIDNDIPLKYECQSGSCGLDPIRIISGGEYLNEVDDEGEAWTLDEICQLKAGNASGECRLACMTKASGPVVVEIVKK